LLRYALAAGALSLGLRLAWALHAHVTPIADFASYDAIAWRWLATGHYGSSAHRTPGYPAFLAAVYAGAGHSWGAAGLAQAVLGGLTSSLVVLLAAYVVSLRGALVAGLLHAFSPTAVAYVPVLASENLAAPLVVGALLCLAASRHNRATRWWALVASGFLLGLHLLVRPAGVYFVPGFLLVAAFMHKGRGASVLAPVLLVSVLVLTLAPWLVRNHLIGLGATTLATAGGMDLWMGNNELAQSGGDCPEARDALVLTGLGERDRDAAYRSAAVTWMRRHPRRYLSLCVRRASRLLGTEADAWAAKYLTPSRQNDLAMAAVYRAYDSGASASPELEGRGRAVQKRNLILLTGWRIIVAPLALFALVLSLIHWRRYGLVAAPSLSYLLGLSLTFAKPRFRELSDPLLFIPLAALLCDMLVGTAELGVRPSRRVKAAVGAALVVVVGVVKVLGYLL
jgi:4-amino-4-deoxy-L-arabinose transferase-like glycosyltransferase